MAVMCIASFRTNLPSREALWPGALIVVWAQAGVGRQRHPKPPQGHIVGIYSAYTPEYRATSKPPQGHHKAIYLGVQSHPKATPKPPQGYPKATPRLPQSQVHATYKPGDWLVLRWITLVLPLRYRCSTVVSLVFLRLSAVCYPCNPLGISAALLCLHQSRTSF